MSFSVRSRAAVSPLPPTHIQYSSLDPCSGEKLAQRSSVSVQGIWLWGAWLVQVPQADVEALLAGDGAEVGERENLLEP